MQAEYLKRRFEIKDDLHRLISGIELIQEGLKDIPLNMKISDNELVPYTEEDYKILNEIRECESKLSQTDWYVIRFIDSEKEIPSEIKKERQKLRERISELKEKI